MLIAFQAGSDFPIHRHFFSIRIGSFSSITSQPPRFPQGSGLSQHEIIHTKNHAHNGYMSPQHYGPHSFYRNKNRNIWHRWEVVDQWAHNKMHGMLSKWPVEWNVNVNNIQNSMQNQSIFPLNCVESFCLDFNQIRYYRSTNAIATNCRIELLLHIFICCFLCCILRCPFAFSRLCFVFFFCWL